MIFIDQHELDGSFTMNAYVDYSSRPPVIKIEGVIRTKQRLPESFKVLAGGRILCRDIMIISESVGSDDPYIVSGFTAKAYDILEEDDIHG